MSKWAPLAAGLALVALVAGYLASQAWQNYRVKTLQRAMHAEIAAIRTYEEGFALRNGHYLLLPSSCAPAGHDRWRELGKAPPAPSVGCFWVEAPQAATTAVTAPTMAIVGESTALNLRGTETDADRAPTWTAIR